MEKSNHLLGRLNDFIRGADSDYQEDDQEKIREDNDNLFDSYEEPNMMEEKQEIPPIQPKPRRRHREKSDFQMDFSSESSVSRNTSRNTPSNVIEMPGVENSMNEIVVIEPHSFEEIPQVIQTLKDRRCVVLNLNVMDPDEAQRAVDFIAGGTYAIDGHQERIGESIFLFTPKTVKVSTISGNSHQQKESITKPSTSSTSFSDSLWNDDKTALG